MSKEITGALFKQMILHGAAAITAQKQAINDLNVFPVPDGDTGTNMSMTIATAAEALRKAAPASVGQASSVTASALLQGARGNSGVILSLLFRGLSNRMAVQTDFGPAPILGRICMDMTMVDLTALPDVHVGDAVELFGRRQRADELAELLGTIPYELTCAVSKRVPRLYMEDGREVERSLRLLL